MTAPKPQSTSRSKTAEILREALNPATDSVEQHPVTQEDEDRVVRNALARESDPAEKQKP